MSNNILINIRNVNKGIQWLGLCAFHCWDLGSIPGWGTKILQATCPKTRKRE